MTTVTTWEKLEYFYNKPPALHGKGEALVATCWLSSQLVSEKARAENTQQVQKSHQKTSIPHLAPQEQPPQIVSIRQGSMAGSNFASILQFVSLLSFA